MRADSQCGAIRPPSDAGGGDTTHRAAGAQQQNPFAGNWAAQVVCDVAYQADAVEVFSKDLFTLKL